MGDSSKKESILYSFVNDKFVKSILEKESYEKIKQDVALKEEELLELRKIRDSHKQSGMLSDEDIFKIKERLMGDVPVNRLVLRKVILEYEDFRNCVKTFSELFSSCELGVPICSDSNQVPWACPECHSKLNGLIGFIFPSDKNALFEKRD